MKTLIAYMTSHGCAEKAARLIQHQLPGKPVLFNVENQDIPDLSGFDLIIVGGSIRMGAIQKRIRKFCEKNATFLLEKKIGLYICCMYEGEKAREQFLKNFPEPLVAHATAQGIFGGELDLDALNAFERMIIKEIIGITINVSLFREEAVKSFCTVLEKESK